MILVSIPQARKTAENGPLVADGVSKRGLSVIHTWAPSRDNYPQL